MPIRITIATVNKDSKPRKVLSTYRERAKSYHTLTVNKASLSTYGERSKSFHKSNALLFFIGLWLPSFCLHVLFIGRIMNFIFGNEGFGDLKLKF